MRIRLPRMHPYPKTPEEWLGTARELAEISKEAMASVAAEVNEDELALEIRENSDKVFPADRYRRELNRRSRGAGDGAEELAGQELRRRRC
jgi:hypothetical protein